MITRLGFQAWSVKDHMTDEDSVRSTFQALTAAGYDNVQTAGMMGLTYETYARLAKEAGLEICGSHESFADLVANPEQAMANHRVLGTKNIGIGGYSGVLDTVERVQDFIAQVNRFAKIIAKEGFTFTYHNHHREFCKVGGKTIMDWFIEGFHPEYTSFVLDTYWAQVGGADVRQLMERLDGRIEILHLKDMMLQDDLTPRSTEIGSGNLYWDGIMAVAEQIGVRYYVVEQEEFLMDELESMRRSSAFLQRYR